MDLKHIRNFSIIAHIDHGKSTLADRMLEITGTIEKRKMTNQVLDTMELEKERGITIKMTPVSMSYKLEGVSYSLNLIDTPGHIDFSYEVSRALKAVEGSILLVDATQGVQAQTLTTLQMARDSGLKIIPVLSKIDSPLARIEDVKREVMELLGCEESEILEVSGRTGEGVAHLIEEIVRRVPPPIQEYSGPNDLRALVFDFKYSNHKGVIVYVRVLDGVITKNTNLLFSVSKEKFMSLEVGIFSPGEVPTEKLLAGEIGYIVTGIKKPGIASVGDTITLLKNPLPELPGYMKPYPVVWASIYPESQDDFPTLKMALSRLRLSDSSFSYDEETSGALGRGYRCGFLGMLHLEIISERLRREFNLNLIVTTPSITYYVVDKNNKEQIIYSPHQFPDEKTYLSAREPWVKLTIITPVQYLGTLMQLLYEHEAEVGVTENFGDNRSRVQVEIALREMMRNFFDELKSISSGYASVSYEIGALREADVTRLDIMINEEVVPAFSRVVSKRQVDAEAEKAIEKLANILPRQQIQIKMQAYGMGRIISAKTLSAFRKDVTQHMYGGDITRKMKLREKQKKGKKIRAQYGKRVEIPEDVFMKMVQDSER